MLEEFIPKWIVNQSRKMVANKKGTYTKCKKRKIFNKEGCVLDIRKHRGKEQAVKIWVALIFARHIERNIKVVFI